LRYNWVIIAQLKENDRQRLIEETETDDNSSTYSSATTNQFANSVKEGLPSTPSTAPSTTSGRQNPSLSSSASTSSLKIKKKPSGLASISVQPFASAMVAVQSSDDTDYDDTSSFMSSNLSHEVASLNQEGKKHDLSPFGSHIQPPPPTPFTAVGESFPRTRKISNKFGPLQPSLKSLATTNISTPTAFAYTPTAAMSALATARISSSQSFPMSPSASTSSNPAVGSVSRSMGISQTPSTPSLFGTRSRRTDSASSSSLFDGVSKVLGMRRASTSSTSSSRSSTSSMKDFEP
jgi:hypothetical protein